MKKNKVKIRNALISVSNKKGLGKFVKNLCLLGVKIIASGGKTLANSKRKFSRTSLHDLCDESPGAGRGPARPRAKTRRLSRG